MIAPSSSHSLLVLDDVSRRFGVRTVVNRVTLTVEPGEIHLVVGPNGSGKSTLGRLAVGLLRPHGGTVRIRGVDPRGAAEARAGVGYAGHESHLYDDLTPEQNLEFGCRLHGIADGGVSVAGALDQLAVGAERRHPVRRLSRGYVQRVALARSLVQRPLLVVWDEPLTGLDQSGVGLALETIEAERARGAGIVIVTHDLPELWRLPAQVHVIHQGEVRLSADTSIELAAFRREYGALTG